MKKKIYKIRYKSILIYHKYIKVFKKVLKKNVIFLFFSKNFGFMQSNYD